MSRAAFTSRLEHRVERGGPLAEREWMLVLRSFAEFPGPVGRAARLFQATTYDVVEGRLLVALAGVPVGPDRNRIVRPTSPRAGGKVV